MTRHSKSAIKKNLAKQSDLARDNPDRYTGIAEVSFGVADMDICYRFLSDWGLIEKSRSPSECVWQTQVGQIVRISLADDPELPAAIQPGPTLRRVVWGVRDDSDLSVIARELEGDHDVSRDDDGALRTSDPNGLGIAFKVFAPKDVDIERQSVNAPGSRQRVGVAGHSYERGIPIRISHVVFQSPFLDEMETFYRERLGFWLSDRYVGKAAFLRCAARSDHHNLAVFRTSVTEPHFEHIAFEVRDVHEVFSGGLYIRDKGWESQFGPGRHTTSSAYFWYFQSPCGGNIEYFADMDFADETWTPSDMPPSPTSMAEWGLYDGIDRFDGRFKPWIRTDE